MLEKISREYNNARKTCLTPTLTSCLLNTENKSVLWWKTIKFLLHADNLIKHEKERSLC